jgi:hypothetical protein
VSSSWWLLVNHQLLRGVTYLMSTGRLSAVGFVLLGAGVGGLASLLLPVLDIDRRRRTLRNLLNTTLTEPATREQVRRLIEDEANLVQSVLDGASRDVAEALGVSNSLTRAALFAPDDDGERAIVASLWIYDPAERTVKILPGQGSAGRSFAANTPNVAVLMNVLEDSTIGDRGARSHVNAKLRWIVSVPVLARLTNPRWF